VRPACLWTRKISCPKCRFCLSKSTNFVQNFLHISNFCLNLIQNCEFRFSSNVLNFTILFIFHLKQICCVPINVDKCGLQLLSCTEQTYSSSSRPVYVVVVALQILSSELLHNVRPLSFCHQRAVVTYCADSQDAAASRRPLVRHQQILMTTWSYWCILERMMSWVS